MKPSNAFIFTCCQPGAENALKSELATQWPEFNFAFSRPGFVTFKTGKQVVSEDLDLRSVFATTYGVSLGKVAGDLPAEALADQLWQALGDQQFDLIHVWQRPSQVPGDRGYEPGETELARNVGELLLARAPAGHSIRGANVAARAGQRVLDCVLVEPNSWWYGAHCGGRFSARYPGGVMPVELPEDTISRAYLKIVEAMEWSRIPFQAGDKCVEIGSSPGGSCQAMLERGLIVTGIDPAEMAPQLLENPNFTYVRARGSDLKRREFTDYRWLVADSNVAPKHTLDTVEHIVTNRSVHIRGLLLTLKLLQWNLADEIPTYIERVRSWGYELVKARQLAYNRQEICLSAVRRKSMLREPPWRKEKA